MDWEQQFTIIHHILQFSGAKKKGFVFYKRMEPMFLPTKDKNGFNVKRLLVYKDKPERSLQVPL